MLPMNNDDSKFCTIAGHRQVHQNPLDLISRTAVESDVVNSGPTYFKSRTGLLKISQVVISLITTICSYSQENHRFYVDPAQGGSWVEFTAVSAVLFGIIIIVIYLFDISSKIPSKIPCHILELTYLAVYTVFYLICVVIAGAFATNANNDKFETSGAAAATVFSTLGMCVYAVDAILMILKLRVDALSNATNDNTCA